MTYIIDDVQKHLLARLDDLDGADTQEKLDMAVTRAEASVPLVAEIIKGEAARVATAEVQMRAYEARSRLGAQMQDLPMIGVDFKASRLVGRPNDA